MKLHYYPETDSLYIELNPRPSTDSREVVDGLVADLDVEGNVVGIDIDQASKKLDLSSLEALGLPTTSLRVA
ncbi:MAG: DUF2283 domain-containing protein [Deltaproteobacteria bacterium]|nr:DUF2283 domain-containing protein [Deltaproteobacteria bacterium]